MRSWVSSAAPLQRGLWSLVAITTLVGCNGPVSAPPLPQASAPPSASHHRHSHHGHHDSHPDGTTRTSAGEVPEKVEKVLAYIDRSHEAPEGYEGGRTFHNAGSVLPGEDRQGRAVTYQEWDVNPHVADRNRGAERLITGSDGSAYYTADHYRTFTRIR